jgi:hypothetical protein
LGVVVPAGDASALADALERVLTDEAFRTQAIDNITRVRESYRWHRVLAPLLHYVAGVGHPEEPALASREGTKRFSPLRPRTTRFRPGDIGRGLQRLGRGEFRLIVRAIARRIVPRSR